MLVNRMVNIFGVALLPSPNSRPHIAFYNLNSVQQDLIQDPLPDLPFRPVRDLVPFLRIL